MNTFISPDEIPAWSGESTRHDGFPEYELKIGLHSEVSMMQAMVGQDGPILEAHSGNCLVIAAYSVEHRAGLLMHLWREENLDEEASNLITKPFQEFQELCENVIVHFLSSERYDAECPNQMLQAKKLIAGLAPSSTIHVVNVEDRDGEFEATVELRTAEAKLVIHDDFASRSSEINYSTFSTE